MKHIDSRQSSLAILLLALAVACAGVAGAKTCTWINTETSAAQSWSVAANWDGENAPAAGDDVVVTNSAYIDFTGAEIGNLLHTAGDLKLEAASATPLVLNGDLITRGKSVNTWATISLSEGTHVLSNACDFVLRASQNITGSGSLVKKGKGSVSGSGWEGNLKLTFTGSFTLYEGSFGNGYYTGFAGPTEIIVDGSSAVLACPLQGNNWFNKDCVLRLRNGATVSFSFKNYSHTVKQLYINDEQAIAGSWTIFDSSRQVVLPACPYLTGAENIKLVVTEGPDEGGYKGFLDDFSSGVTNTWTGANGTSWSDAANWDTGKVPAVLDSVILPADTANKPSSIPEMAYHDFKNYQSGDRNYNSMYIYGDAYFATGKHQWSFKHLQFMNGVHYLDGPGTVNPYCNWLGCYGTLYKIGSGTILDDNNQYGTAWSFKDLVVSNGTVQLHSATTFSGCTNIVVYGSRLIFNGTAIGDGAPLKLVNGACVELPNSRTTTVYRLSIDGVACRAGRTYGSSASAADYQEDVHYAGAGLLKPLGDDTGLDPLPTNRFTVLDIGTAYYDFKTPCRPTLTLVDESGNLVSTNDYTVAYENNEAIGTGRAIITGKAGTDWEGIRFIRFFTIEKDPSLRDTCYWINTETASAQPWNVTTSWKDITGDGVGDPPGQGDHVVISAAANIDFSGADIGNLVHTNGALTLTTGSSTPMTLRGNFITTGASVKTTANTVLYEGEHIFSNACTYTIGNGMVLSGAGSLTKMGSGTWEIVQFQGGTYSFTGDFKILEGTFRGNQYSGFSGPTTIIVDGSTSVLVDNCQGNNSFNSKACIHLQNGGRLYASWGGYSVAIKELWVDGRQGVAGNWYPFDAASPRVHTTTSMYGKTDRTYIVSSGPAEGGWEGFDTTVPWSGRTCTWIGGGTTSSATDPTNWKDGLVSWYLDDVVIAGSGAPESLQQQYFHDLTLKVDWGPQVIYLSGDLHLNGGTLTRGWATYYLLAGQHVVDGTGGISPGNGTCFAGAGGMTWRSTGTFELGQYANAGGNTFTGPLRWEAGKFVQNGGTSGGKAAFGGTTNVVISGAGTEMQFNIASQPGFSTNAVLTIEKGGKLKLCEDMTQKVLQFYTTSRQRNAHQYTGAGDVGRKLPNYLSGKGVLEVRESGPQGGTLHIR